MAKETRWEDRFSYLDIGHETKNAETWALVQGKLLTSTQADLDKEKFHVEIYGDADFTGRIDHDQKMISAAPTERQEFTSETKQKYVVSLLKRKWPDYTVWWFPLRFKEPYVVEKNGGPTVAKETKLKGFEVKPNKEENPENFKQPDPERDNPGEGGKGMKTLVMKEIKDSQVYDLYKDGTNEIDRGPIETEVNSTGESLKRFNELSIILKGVLAGAGINKLPAGTESDANAIMNLINKACASCLAEDGEIKPEDFKKFHDVLASMTEGFIIAVRSGSFTKRREAHDLVQESAGKAFHKQLKKIVEDKKTKGLDVAINLGKALASMLTHVFIESSIDRHFKANLAAQLIKMLESVSKKLAKGQTNVTEEIEVVKTWSLTE